MENTQVFNRKGVSESFLGHLLGTLKKTKTVNDPFSHFYMENVFPESLYANLLEQLPDSKDYRALSLKKYARADGTSTRDLLEISDEGVSVLKQSKGEFWLGIADALKSDSLRNQVFDMLSVDLTDRFKVSREALKEIEAYPKPAIIRDVGGYKIAPHPDVKKKIVTLQFYLPKDRSQEDLGTALYKRKYSLGGMLILKRQFEKVKQFSFLPNSGYGFSVSGKSWHGREVVSMSSGVRNSLLLIYSTDPKKGY
jgi:hypothetical protein